MSNYLQINHSFQAAGLLKDYMANLDHEEMWAMFLNRDNRLINQEMLTKGTLCARKNPGFIEEISKDMILV